MFVLLASVALASASPAASPGPAKPEPVSGSMAGLIGSDDYPPEALNRNEEGTVGVLIRVDDKGAVSDCVVRQSSGSAALDAQTCRLVWLRAKFKPARDKQGKPVAGTKETRVAWRIAGDGNPSEPWAIRAILRAAEGKSPSCHVELEGALKKANVNQSECLTEAGKMIGEIPSTPKSFVELISEQRFDIGRKPQPSMAPGDRLIGRQLAQLEIDAAGVLVSCKSIDEAGTMGPLFPGVCAIVAKRYVPRKGADGKFAPFTAYFLLAGYLHVEKVA